MAAKQQKEQEPTGTGRTRTALLALLVITSVAGGIHFTGGQDEKPVVREYVDDDIVEVSPIVPASRLSGASWRTSAQVREDRAAEDEIAHGESVFDHVEWGEDEEGRAYDKSVEETVRDIDGLGVYVAPVDKKAPAGKGGTR